MTQSNQDSTRGPNDAQPSACSLPSNAQTTSQANYEKSDSEWRDSLTPDQYRVLRQHGTEPPFRNEYFDNKDPGDYRCAGCGARLFSSEEKYDSGSGWPAFWDTVSPDDVGRTVDTSYGMTRVEVHCNRCGGHLGHVFEDGPAPTHLRYCINSASLAFEPNSTPQ